MAEFDSWFNAPETQGMLGLSMGLLQAGSPSRMPVGLGGALAQGMMGMQRGALAARQAEQQNTLVELEKQKLQMQGWQLRQLQNKDNYLRQIAEGFGRDNSAPALGPAPGVLRENEISPAVGASLGMSPEAVAAHNAQLPATQPQRAGPRQFTPQQLTMALAAGLDPEKLIAINKEIRPDAHFAGGAIYDKKNPGAPIGSYNDVNQQGFGFTQRMGPGGQMQIMPSPGAAQTYGLQQMLTQGANAAFGAPVTLPPTTPGANPTMMSPYNFALNQGAPDVLGMRGAPAAPMAPPVAPVAPSMAPAPAPQRVSMVGNVPSAAMNLQNVPPQLLAEAAKKDPAFAKAIAEFAATAPSAPGGVPAGLSPAQNVTMEGSKEAQTQFIGEMRQNYAKLRDSQVTLNNLEAAAKQIPNAAAFMGPFGESKLEVAKFLRSNVPGFSDFKTENVKDAEGLRTAIFTQILDNLKKLDASPSEQQQRVMQDALGKLGTDPAALPTVLGVTGEIVRQKVATHNATVDDAEKRGTAFPYEVRVKLKESAAAQPPGTTGAGLSALPSANSTNKGRRIFDSEKSVWLKSNGMQWVPEK